MVSVASGMLYSSQGQVKWFSSSLRIPGDVRIWDRGNCQVSSARHQTTPDSNAVATFYSKGVRLGMGVRERRKGGSLLQFRFRVWARPGT